MKKFFAAFFVFALVALTAVPAAATDAKEQTWKDVSVTDQMCFEKVKDAPDKHSKECMLKCQKSGYGIIVGEGKDRKFVEFDAAGSKLTIEALKAAKKNIGLKATVVGEMGANVIKVKSITFADYLRTPRSTGPVLDDREDPAGGCRHRGRRARGAGGRSRAHRARKVCPSPRQGRAREARRPREGIVRRRAPHRHAATEAERESPTRPGSLFATGSRTRDSARAIPGRAAGPSSTAIVRST